MQPPPYSPTHILLFLQHGGLDRGRMNTWGFRPVALPIRPEAPDPGGREESSPIGTAYSSWDAGFSERLYFAAFCPATLTFEFSIRRGWF